MSEFPNPDQAHSFDAVVMVWNERANPDRDCGMKLRIENVDSCCESHARESAEAVGAVIAKDFSKIWMDDFRYQVISITQRW